MENNKARWDGMTTDARRKLVLTDKSMRSPVYASLVNTLATSPYDALSGLQKDAVDHYLSLGKKGR